MKYPSPQICSTAFKEKHTVNAVKMYLLHLGLMIIENCFCLWSQCVVNIYILMMWVFGMLQKIIFLYDLMDNACISTTSPVCVFPNLSLLSHSYHIMQCRTVHRWNVTEQWWKLFWFILSPVNNKYSIILWGL